MKIENMSLEEITLELRRAKFWVEDNPIKKSVLLINKLENKKLELINSKLT